MTFQFSLVPEDARSLLQLPTRTLSWIYHVIGARDDANLRIRDTTIEIEFAIKEASATPGGRPTRSLVSGSPIALLAHPPKGFELVEGGPFGPKVIVPVLPAPRPGPTTGIYVTSF